MAQVLGDVPPEQFPEALAAQNEAAREARIAEASDEATRDLRILTGSKALAVTRSEGTITVVEPGARGYYRWQVRRGLTGIDAKKGDARLKTPQQWERHIFEKILRQPLGGGKFKYNSESLEAMSIIEE